MTAEPAARTGSVRRPTPPRTTAAAGRRTPTLRTERALISSGARLVAGMDEVGRGALAGPVSVGVVVVDVATRTAPKGVADSKLLTPAAREALVPHLQRWPVAWAVGHAGPAEIDAHGIIAALRLAGRRALSQVRRVCGDVDVVLLDGSHDWLTRSQVDLFEATDLDVAGAPETDPAVRTMVKADLQCASVAAASVLAKVERDLLLTRLARQYPAYAWDQNKGYSAPAHLEALRRHGTTPQHRRSWNLRSVAEGGEPVADAGAFAEAVVESLDVPVDAPGGANLRG
ncbi:ribonuclease HII [Xylanimonas protaetiae]|uniref:Ribonuclease n=1 Tax=Xylanimonas protaetiae TaxID=2509457 RepID=A0A4P6FAU8_9MICO|nr:ribonuclease HII [Xylanimonas protaetiae]QAY70547.1 ribonuclease HII [Xylanimonas protaetiae]